MQCIELVLPQLCQRGSLKLTASLPVQTRADCGKRRRWPRTLQMCISAPPPSTPLVDHGSVPENKVFVSVALTDHSLRTRPDTNTEGSVFPCLTAPCLHAVHVTPLQSPRRKRLVFEGPGEELRVRRRAQRQGRHMKGNSRAA